MRNLSGAAIAGLALGYAVSAVPAATATMNPVADAFVTSANAANNYGAAGGLQVAASGLPKGEFQTVLRFDLSAAASGFDAIFGSGQWQVQSVTLQLTSTSPNNPIFNTPAAGLFAASWMQNDGWIEGTGTPAAPSTDGLTFNTLPSFLTPSDQSLGTFNFPGGTSGNNTYALGLPASFLADVTAGNNVSFRLLAADGVVSYLFDSRNFGTVAARPLLTVDAIAVPEPAAAAWVSVAALLQVRCRRRRQ